MGIKDLWGILEPYCERKPLYELQDRRVAIDLSGWVCQAQCIAEYSIQPAMYLRNLYFRTNYLLLQKVWPVFVLEGQAPSLKYKTMAARNKLQFKGAKPKSPAKGKPREPKEQKEKAKGRTRFDHVLKQCEQMLQIMGVSCVTGAGEAEAMCAYLNSKNLVEGCISQDSDCFAYGATRVYRNFSISTQGSSAGSFVDVYDLQKSSKDIDFGRNKVVATALLLGSDYNEGVYGVGKESVVKLLKTISDEEILQHLRKWFTNEAEYAALERKISHQCSNCGHGGKKAQHTRKGCILCGTSAGNECFYSEQHSNLRNELNVRSKCSKDFLNEELIDEFLLCKERTPLSDLQWKMPNLPAFIEFTLKFLQWEEMYSFEKFFPLLTRWICLFGNGLRKENLPAFPENIKKVRNPKGTASYEIQWNNSKLLQLIPAEQLENVDLTKLFSSIEPQNLVRNTFPLLVETFEASKAKKKPAKKRKKDQQLLQNKEVVLTAATLDDPLFDTDTDADLSLVIDGITSQELPDLVQEKLCKISAKLKEVRPQKEQMQVSFFDLSTYEALDFFESPP